MLQRALSRTIGQLMDPDFRIVAIIGLVTAMATLLALTTGLLYFWPDSFSVQWDSDWEWVQTAADWINTAASAAAVIIAWYVLFPAVSTAVMGMLLERICNAVERKWYPDRQGIRSIGFVEGLVSGLRFAGFVLLVNILALIPYLILLFTTGFGAAALFLLINGYLLGREYFELVALRHVPLGRMKALRAHYGNKVLMAGLMVALLFLIPGVNLFAPIIGAAVMTHIYHLMGMKLGIPANGA